MSDTIRPLPKKRMEITTIPCFSVSVDGTILKISNAKAKELFALLVDRAGSGITGREKYLVTELVECDLYRILEGDKKRENAMPESI